MLHHGRPITSLTISETVGSLLTGLSVRIIDEGGDEWDNSEGNSVTVQGSWEGGAAGARKRDQRALTQSQAAAQLLQGHSSTLDELKELQLPELIDMDPNSVKGEALPLEFTVSCTVDAPLGEVHLEGDFNISLVPETAVRWHILLHETLPVGGKRDSRKSIVAEDSAELSVGCDDEEDLMAVIRGTGKTAVLSSHGRVCD